MQKNGILIVGRVAGKVRSCVKLLEHPAGEDCDRQVRRLDLVVARASRSYGLEQTTPISPCCQATEPDPTFVGIYWLRIVGMVVLSLRIRLPDFQHRIIDRGAITIEHTKCDPH